MNGVIQKYDRTAQLLDKDNIVDGGAFYPSVTSNRMIASNNTAILLLPCKPNMTYTISRRNVITKRFLMCFLTSNEIYVDMPIYGEAHDDTGLTLTSTSTAESQYLCFYYAKTGGSDSSTPEEIQAQLAEVMINEGATALPYQPYLAFKDNPYTRLETATDTITDLPKTTYNDGTNATVAIKGNMVQSGTSTPSNPITPQECGERTENKFDGLCEQETLSESSAKGSTYEQTKSSSIQTNRIRVAQLVTCGGEVTISCDFTKYQLFLLYYDANGLYTGQHSSDWNSSAVTTNQQYVGIAIRRLNNADLSPADIGDVKLMVNTGSTAKPYEPYGYKLPIVSGGITTNAYLGEVQSTRKIKKIVLTGEEEWQNNFGTSLFGTKINNEAITGITALSTHYTYNPIQSGLNRGLPNGEFALQTSSPPTALYIKDESYTKVGTWKQWLAAQYAAGTPVTVWYVLATETTAIVNEPIRKIGDYADSITNPVTLPTTAGGQTFDVDTMLKPSEVDLTYHGWHEHEPLKRENGAWN